jgi:hypothetical protein
MPEKTKKDISKKVVKSARLAAREVMMEEFQKIIDQTMIPALVRDIGQHKKVLYGNGKAGLITEVAVFKKDVEDQFKAVMAEITGDNGIKVQLKALLVWQEEITKWKNGIIWKVAAVCGFCSGLGAFLGIVIGRSGMITTLLGGGS